MCVMLNQGGDLQGNFEAFEDMYEQKRRENNKKFETFEKQMKAAKKSGSKANQDKVWTPLSYVLTNISYICTLI